MESTWNTKSFRSFWSKIDYSFIWIWVQNYTWTSSRKALSYCNLWYQARICSSLYTQNFVLWIRKPWLKNLKKADMKRLLKNPWASLFNDFIFCDLAAQIFSVYYGRICIFLVILFVILIPWKCHKLRFFISAWTYQASDEHPVF